MNKGELSKNHILDHAVQLASVYGLRGLTIGNLARHTHMSKGGICAHFSSKEVLQLAVIDQASHLFQEAVIIPTLSRDAGKDRLLALGQAWFAYLEQEVFLGGCFFTNVLLEVDDVDDGEARVKARGYYQQFLRFVQGEIKTALRQGQFLETVESGQFAFEFVGILLGVLVWRGLGRQQEGVAYARSLIESLVMRSQV